MIALELPLALLGGLAVIATVLVHAISRRTPREVVLPTVRFLEGAPRARQAFTWPHDLGLLSLRCLAIAAFALAAAHPFIPATPAPQGSGALVLVLDDSLSMAHGSRFERARSALAQRLHEVPAGGRAALLLTSRTGPPAHLAPASEVEAELARAHPSAASTSLLPSLEAAAELAALDPSTRVVLASDLDRPALAGVEQRSEAARRLRLEVIETDDEPRNAYLTDVAVSPSPALQGEAVTVTGRVLESGLGAEPVPVALEVGGHEVARASAVPGALVRFTVPFARAPLVTGALVVHAHGDALEADDRASFVAPVLARISVALLGREEAPDGGENREQPLLDAFAAVGRARDVPIGVHVVTEANLAAALEEANVLVLASPDELRARARDQIARFVEGGHGLIIIVDEDAPRETLRDLAARGVIPATARPLEPGPRARLDARGLDATLGRAFSALALVPQAGLEGGEPLVTAAGEPLWVERGKVVMLGFAPWGRNAGLASQTAFPLVAFRALRAALGSAGAPSPEVGATLALADLARASSIATRALGRATLVLPDGTTRSLAGEDVLRVAQPGVHVIRDRDEVLAAFAARASEKESRLERASPAERALLASAPAVPEAPRERGDLDLTLYAILAGSLLLALACLLAQGRRSSAP